MTPGTMTLADLRTCGLADWRTKHIMPVLPGGKEAVLVLWYDVLNELGGRVPLLAEVKADCAKYVAPETLAEIIHSVKFRG